jgi:hypothetical protein
MSSATSLEKGLFACAALAFLCVGVLGVVVACDGVFCRETLREVSEPPDWRSWRELPDMGGYSWKAGSVRCADKAHMLVCSADDVTLSDDRVCPRCGVSLGHVAGGYEGRDEFALHVRGETFVVARIHTTIEHPPEPAAFAVAFQRERGLPRLAFRHDSAVYLAASFAAILALLGAAGIAAMRSRTRAVAYRDTKRYRAGLRRGDMVTFEDGTAPLHLSKREVACLVENGRVLCEVTAVEDGAYRFPPRAHASRIRPGDADGLATELLVRASRRLTCALCAAVVVALSTGLTLGFWLMVEILGISLMPR